MSMQSTRGKLIVLEGIDGSGTTSQLDRAVAFIRSLGLPAASTQEPSRGPIGQLLREALLGKLTMSGGERMNGGTMALLFAADRRDHLQREIEPQLMAGTTIVSDRYLMSSLAYQAEETDRDWVLQLARGVPRPDLTVVFDLSVEVAARRRVAAGRPVERYDADSFLAKVAENYRRLAQQDSTAVVIDASRTKEEVSDAVCRAIAPLFASTR